MLIFISCTAKRIYRWVIFRKKNVKTINIPHPILYLSCLYARREEIIKYNSQNTVFFDVEPREYAKFTNEGNLRERHSCPVRPPQHVNSVHYSLRGIRFIIVKTVF